MNKLILTPVILIVLGLVSGCTTEKHYPAQPATVIYQDKTPPSDSRSEAREGARQGAREGVHDAK
jgi:hypothetical protein